MAVPSSGELKLRADIALEVDGSATGDNVSLGTLSNTAEFTEPDNMSDFYGYVAAEEATFSNITFSNVYDTSMRATVTITNPSELHIDFGYYFGTSTNMTSNTKYTVNDNTASSINFYRDFTGLSASTTYYCWTWCTYRGGEFSESSSSMNTQATGASITYSYRQSSGTQPYTETASGVGSSSSATYRSQYNHTYYGWTTQNSATSSSSNDTGGARAYYYGRETYRSGVTTANRVQTYWSCNKGIVPQYQLYLVMPQGRTITSFTNSSSGPKSHPDSNTISTSTLPTSYGSLESGNHYYCCLGGGYTNTRNFNAT